ncbi:Ankyrin repeat-containing domain [Pseudocohnilembus persalinus]|uniref:Ankyrin repeat-containing domain n=1 Tax=Pseudocohnilembus persalinus TaxID=266149 RepID=A0A0V0QGV5_PSEPJ|nr:Ankyrin repeat-containing domain [Pseudocohnilembus persalinus]|eukprot:KRX01433.1 Ankyrin repeat-containing domain [Pseudocohnilembus persalinus]
MQFKFIENQYGKRGQQLDSIQKIMLAFLMIVIELPNFQIFDEDAVNFTQIPYIQVQNFLVYKNKNQNIKQGNTLAHVICSQGYLECLKLLEKYNQQHQNDIIDGELQNNIFQRTNKNNEICLRNAVIYNRGEIVEYLLSKENVNYFVEDKVNSKFV